MKRTKSLYFICIVCLLVMVALLVPACSKPAAPTATTPAPTTPKPTTPAPTTPKPTTPATTTPAPTKPAPTPAATVYKWKLQGQHPSNDQRQMMLEHLAKNLNVMSQGMIEITIYPIDTLVPTTEMLDAQKNGIIDMAHPCSGYFGGVDPVFNTLPALWDFRNMWEANHFMYELGGGDLLRKTYAKYGVYYIGMTQTGGRELVYSKVPIRTVADFKGKKIRSFGQFAWFFEELGMSTVYFPGGEIISALSTGAIDAAEFSGAYGDYLLGMHKVTKYQIYPFFIWALGGCDLTMSKKIWDGLPPYLQTIITVATREAHDWVGRIYNDYETTYFNKMLVEGPQEKITIPENEWPQLVAAAERVRDKLAKASPDAAEMVRLTREYMKTLGYLPASW